MLARWGLLLAVVVGVVAAVLAFRVTGVGQLVTAMTRMGLAGFGAYCLYSVGVFAILGAAWSVAAAEERRRIVTFTWARMVREAAADLLPFSQIGGIVLAVRSLTAAGIPSGTVLASMVVDLTTELASQVVLTLGGLAGVALLLTDAAAHRRLDSIIWTAPAGLLAITTLLLLGQTAGLRVARRIAIAVLPQSSIHLGDPEAELGRLYAIKTRVALAFFLNLLAWVASAAGAFVALRLMDMPAALSQVLVLETLVFLSRSVAFMIPAGLGVQETVYLVLGPALGMPTDVVMALALAKRARDLILGLVTLLVWQMLEFGGIALPLRRTLGKHPVRRRKGGLAGLPESAGASEPGAGNVEQDRLFDR